MHAPPDPRPARATAAPSCAVAICTFDPARWNDLVAAVTSVEEQEPPPAELIVVVDHAPELLARARVTIPTATVVPADGVPGLASARNTAIARASSDVIAFLDDDAVARPGWLAALLAPYADPTVVATGGHITPRWPDGTRPSWFPPAFDWVVGCSYAPEVTVPTPVRNPLGANMSFRRASLVAAGGFRTEMGRTGADAAGCEETELAVRVRDLTGGRAVLVPGARVDHRVTPARATWCYFARRCFAEGRSKWAVARRVGHRALRVEWEHSARALPAAGWRAVARGHLAQAVAIAVGLTFAGAGYVAAALGTLARRSRA